MKIGFVGFGHLAHILFSAMDKAKFVPRSAVLFSRRDRDKAKDDEKKFGITVADVSTLVSKSDVLLLCVKPQQVDEILAQMGDLKGKWLISVLAGTRISELTRSGAEVLRAMPNVCSAVNEGMTIFSHGEINREFVSFANRLFGTMGETVTVDESLMDIATAIAGCGPGFVFRLIEAMAKTGESRGIDLQTARKMAAQTFAGAARMILDGSSPEDLLRQIATPQGVTQAGLDFMTQTGVDRQFQLAIETAEARSKSLSKKMKT